VLIVSSWLKGEEVEAVCTPPEVACNNRCTNLMTSSQHCGACNTPVPPNSTCVSGNIQCNGTLELCDGVCTNTQTSLLHCGSCNSPVPPNSTCVSGEAQCNATRYKNCDNPGGTVVQCSDTNTDISNCGTCDNNLNANPNTANDGAECINGVGQCKTGRTNCAASGTFNCVNLQTDLNNCGACSSNNQNATSCSGGVYVCNTGYNTCGGNTCNYNLLNATNSTPGGQKFCGQCGSAYVLPSGAACVNGSVQCPGTFQQCPGSAACVDLQTNKTHCGACFRAPFSQTYCLAGSPSDVCPVTHTVCPSTTLLIADNIPSTLDGYYTSNTCLNLTSVATCGFKDGNQNCNVENCSQKYPGAARLPACCQSQTSSRYECADLNNSPRHCGSCANDCQADPNAVARFCVNGQCSITP